MKLEIIRNDSYNCFQNQVAAVARYYRTDYRMMMLELWGFIYNQDKDTIGERMGLIWMGELEYRKRLLSNFHGINFVNYKSILDIKNRTDGVKKNPIAFYVDSFDCEWLPFYRKQHRQHMCNIVDIDEFYCYCQDDYWNKKEYKLFKVDEIDKMSRELLVFSFETVNGLCKYKMNEAIAEAIRRYDEKQCLKKMRLFVEDFSKNFDFDKEIPEGDPVCSKAIMYLKGLGDDKKNLLEFFDFLNSTFHADVSEAKQILDEQTKKFYSIRNYLIKTYFGKKEIHREIIKKELESILAHEYKLYEYFVNLRV